MKKLFPFVLVILVLFSACGNESQTVTAPRYKVENESFSCSPQELIDTLNQMSAMTKTLPHISKWRGSDLQISGPDLSMHINDSLGKVEIVGIDWKADADPSVLSQAEALTGMLLNLLVPDPDPIQQEISSAIDKNSGSVDETHEDVRVYFDTSGTNVIKGWNSLLIKVIDKSLQGPRNT